MNEETLKALKSCIDEKWEKIVDCEMRDAGPNNCDLCDLFSRRQDDADNCIGCPVFNKTGKQYCIDTPNQQWCGYLSLFGADSVFDQKSQNLAIAELDFLKSLLPGGK